MASSIDRHIKLDLGLESRLVRQVVKEILAEYDIKKYDLAVELLNDREMADLNQRFYGVMGSTDVLTFVLEGEPLEAEILLCREQVKLSAEFDNLTVRQEALKLLIHGLLHIAGIHHHTAEERGKNLALTEQYLHKYLNRFDNNAG